MIRSRNFIKLLPLILSGIAFYSCTNKKLDSAPCNTLIGDTVSFTRDVQPFFDTYCNTSGCHTGSNPSAGLSLDASVAYSNLFNGRSYVNIQTPASSVLYTKMNSNSGVMPPSGKLNPCRVELILKWIEEGGREN